MSDMVEGEMLTATFEPIRVEWDIAPLVEAIDRLTAVLNALAPTGRQLLDAVDEASKRMGDARVPS